MSKERLKQLHLTVRNREGILFEGEVVSISGVNVKGKFDVLPLHGNFIALLDQELVVRKLDKSEEMIKVPRGVLKVVANKVEVLVGVG